MSFDAHGDETEDLVDVLDALAQFEAKDVGVLLKGISIGGPTPLLVIRGPLGQVEMVGESMGAGDARGVAFFPVGSGQTVGWGPTGFYINASDFRWARRDQPGGGVSICQKDVILQVRPD